MNGQTDVPSHEGISKNLLSSASLTALRAKAITVLHAQGWSQHHIAQVLQVSQPAIFKHLQKVPPTEAHSPTPVPAAQPVSEGDNRPDALPPDPAPIDRGEATDADQGDNLPDPAVWARLLPKELVLALIPHGVRFEPLGQGGLAVEVPEALFSVLTGVIRERGRELRECLAAVRTVAPPCPCCQGRVFWEACAFCQPPPTALGVQLIWRRGAP